MAHENYDVTGGKLGVRGFKHILTGIPKTFGGGTAASASAQGISNQYSCLVRKDYIDGKQVLCYDPLNYVDIDASGTERLDEIRSALGK